MQVLLQQLGELSDCKLVEKKSFEGYSLKAEYSITVRGKRILEAITIMQNVGVEIMQDNGMDSIFKEKEGKKNEKSGANHRKYD